ncbi:hypothetical protein LTR66_006048 [Elasticomyces elasticus]|nr:hypothetical protein LTR66_006048 [Elasticomyces elasticus]KAK5011464.1 hypothetical protein LTR28_002479 [Elasticomyces elasticus]
MSKLPDFDSLPAVQGMPKGCAWGVFDKDGKKDVYGCFNLLTPDVVKAAIAEAKEGVSVSLNWPIGAIKTPGFGRKGLVHKVIDFNDSPLQVHGFDDELEFNTQCSSQWDSLCHFKHQDSALGYNGAKGSVKELTQDFGNVDKKKTFPTLEHLHERGGIVGRGVLLDYRAYAEAKGIKYSCFDNHAITTSVLDDVAKHQGTELKQGDILIIRSGFTEDLGDAGEEEQAQMLGTHKAVGVEGTGEAAKWFWNHHFAAVVGDTIAFEVLPAVPAKELSGKGGTIGDLVLHQYFLSFFGLNIGELWYLKGLAEQCAKLKRYSFLLTSVPLNVHGSIGSPPNALAIF